MRVFYHRTRLVCMIPLILVAVLTLSGCASKFLYNSAQDKQGQAATKAASEYKPVDTVTIVEKRFEGLLALELDAAEKRFANIRELEIRELAFKDTPISETLIKRIENRLYVVKGQDKAALKKLEMERDLIKMKLEERITGFIENFSLPTFSREELCNEKVMESADFPKTVKEKIPKKEEVAANFVRQILPKCKDFLDSQGRLDKVLKPGLGTKLPEAITQLELDKAEKKKNDEEREEAKKALGKAIKDYTDEAKKLEKPENSKTYAARIKEAAKKLQDVLGGLETAQKAVGMEVVAEERLRRIEEVISAVAGGNVDTSKWGEELRKSVAIVGSLPALADEAQKMLLEAQRPRLTPLVIAREHQREIVEEGVKINEVLKRRIEASEKIVEAYQNELKTLLHIYNQISAEGQKPWHSKSLLQLSKDKELPPKEKRLLYELLGIYFDDVPRFQRDEELWEYRRVATFYDETIVRSKYAAMMWQNLIEGVANVLAGYHSTGIKPEDLARLIEALGVISIGVGVNR